VLKGKVFAGITKLEDVNKRAKATMDKLREAIFARYMGNGKNCTENGYVSETGSRHSHSTFNPNKFDRASAMEVKDKAEQIFLLTLFTFDPESPVHVNLVK
jgi:hypothetical protein